MSYTAQAADFLLQWEGSSKLIIRDRKYLHYFISIIHFLCEIETRSLSFPSDLYLQFEEMEDSFYRCHRGLDLGDE